MFMCACLKVTILHTCTYFLPISEHSSPSPPGFLSPPGSGRRSIPEPIPYPSYSCVASVALSSTHLPPSRYLLIISNKVRQILICCVPRAILIRIRTCSTCIYCVILLLAAGSPDCLSAPRLRPLDDDQRRNPNVDQSETRRP